MDAVLNRLIVDESRPAPSPARLLVISTTPATMNSANKSLVTYLVAMSSPTDGTVKRNSSRYAYGWYSSISFEIGSCESGAPGA